MFAEDANEFAGGCIEHFHKSIRRNRRESLAVRREAAPNTVSP